MQFPQSELNLDQYHSKIYSVLQDQSSILFIDTNILARFFSFHSVTRLELSNYLKNFVDKDRLKVPAWVLNEYSKHFIRKRTSRYYESANKISTITSEFNAFAKFARMFIESSDLSKYGYVDEQAFHSDLDLITEKLNNLSKIKSTKGDYTVKVHDELEKLLNKCVLDSDIFLLAEEICPGGANRYLQELPPGFEDGGKDVNSFGDLITWKEIVSYSKTKMITKAVILTNDNKKDWLYAPHKIIRGNRSLFNSEPEYKIADNRLVYEFSLATGSNELYIINLSTLVTIVSTGGDNSLLQVGKALQLEFESKKQDKDASKEINKNSTISSSKDSSDNSVSETPTTEYPTLIVPPEFTENANSIYLSTALADSQYTTFTNPRIAAIVADIKSYNWYTQNPALVEIITLLQTNTFDSEQVKSDLFVLGRNIYQAACGSAYQAVSFLTELSTGRLEFLPSIEKHLIAGMCYELYFDSNNNLRKGDFKITFIDTIFEILLRSRHADSLSFIQKVLNPYLDYLIITPSATKAYVSFQITSHCKYPGDITKEMYEISSVQYQGEELLKDVEMPNFGNVLHPADYIIKLLTRTFAIPEYYIKLEYLGDLPRTNIYISPNKLLWRGQLPPLKITPVDELPWE
jgi:predicted nucleic acid-binding protein